MKSFSLAAAFAATLSLVAATPTKSLPQPPSKRASLPQVSVSGNAFYADGKRFFIRGIDYHVGDVSNPVDPLANAESCKRDVADLKDLGVNVIRVYSIDNSADHDECMQALNDAGIYLVLDLNTVDYSLNREDPHVSYNAKYLQSVFSTAEQFAKYDNTLAFFSGNEVMNDQPDTDKAAPYVKAVTRDVKNFLNSRGLRKVPVGYAAADVSQNRMQIAQYMNCGSDDARSDFFAFNDYSWCNSDYDTSGYADKVKNFTDYGLPIFLSEYGCIKNRPRKFDELSALMDPKMTGVYSGGIMYEYLNEDNDYGIATLKGNTVSKSQPEFDNFKNALEQYAAPDGDAGASSESHAVDCPSSGPDWTIKDNSIPVLPEEAEVYMKKGAGTGPGYQGDGSQNAGDSGTATASTTGGQASPTGSASSDDDGDDDSAAMTLAANKGALFVSGLTVLFTLFGSMLL